MKKWMSLLVFVLIIGLVLSGCVGRKKEPEKGAPGQVQKQDKYGGTFKGRLAADPPTLDPAYITDTTSSQVANNIFDGLVQYDENLNVVGAIAKDWDISDDGLVWKFYLRKGVKFHNGREVKAEDVEYSFTRLLDPKTKSPRAWLFDNVKGAKAFQNGEADRVEGFKVIDDYTFQITLEEPFTPFLSVLAMTNASIVPKEEVEKYGEDFTSHPVGTGAFKFVEWMHDDHVTLEAFEDYFEGRPYLDKIVFRIIPEDSSAFAEYEQGNIYDLTTIPDGQIERVLNSDEFKDELIKKPQLGVYYIGLNTTKPPLNNKKVRQAINHAINKELIAEVLRHGTVIPAKGILPPGMPGYNKDLKALEYNVEKAKKLLAEAGYPNGIPGEIELAYNTSKGHQMIAEAVQSDLKKIGINVKLVNMDWGAYITKVDNGDTQMFRLGWIGDYPDPDNFLYVLLHSSNAGPGGNGSFYSNPEFDRLTEKARGMKPGPERIKLYQQAEQIAVNDAPWVPIYYYTNLILRKPFVHGYMVTPLGVMPLKTVWLSENK
ncbi:peptide ABC transporter substrate-binding protein [Anoxybacter fermentans]|uniref:Peptide ABC transporter substrate-binding protein n=1 Tax=Anoxybacter fermentans TaxID=1323375 RepID=A0A3S9SZM3_9FIRM|nr:ABC transporter substrate-binding protein [Anoxybacter fermentans]AZR73715.1 peptide ABC transporter substrate-binding protein [Anoxybacter fermentans]